VKRAASAPHLFDQLLHEHELTAALGHAHRLSVEKRQSCTMSASKRSRAESPVGDMAVVIGAEEIDDRVRASEFAIVVEGDVHAK